MKQVHSNETEGDGSKQRIEKKQRVDEHEKSLCRVNAW